MSHLGNCERHLIPLIAEYCDYITLGKLSLCSKNYRKYCKKSLSIEKGKAKIYSLIHVIRILSKMLYDIVNSKKLFDDRGTTYMFVSGRMKKIITGIGHKQLRKILQYQYREYHENFDISIWRFGIKTGHKYIFNEHYKFLKNIGRYLSIKDKERLSYDGFPMFIWNAMANYFNGW